MAGDVPSESAIAIRPCLGHNGPRPFVHTNMYLQLRSDLIDRKIVGMAKRSPLEPVRTPKNTREAQLIFSAPQFFHREPGIVQRDECHPFKPSAVMAAILG